MKLTQTATYWTLAASMTLIIGISSAFAQDVHICEELMRQEHTEAEMKTCIEEFGEPESFRTNRDQQRRSEDAQAEAQREREQYFDKIFTSAELRRFGAPYVARRNFYSSNGRIYRTKNLTEEKDLCKYLGFDENVGDGAVSEAMEDFDHMNFVGVTVNDPLFSSLEAKQFRFDESDDPSNIQVYTSLVCRRDRKEGDPESSVVSSTEAVNDAIQSGSFASQQNDQDNSQRRRSPVIDENSPYIYVPERNRDSSGR